MEGGHFFWLGASADADSATHEPSQSSLPQPCGERPLRKRWSGCRLGEYDYSSKYDDSDDRWIGGYE